MYKKKSCNKYRNWIK